jgi:ABC-type bacteriocin/lantibiotic exporter with double-glycine peptidase domain
MPTCPYHGNETPCSECKIQSMGAYAHEPRGPSLPYVIPAKRPIHIKQWKKDACGIAACAMIGANLNCPRKFDLDQITEFMTTKGIYASGQMALFHALDRVFEWLGLTCKMKENVSLKDIPDLLRPDLLILLEAKAHVIVIYAVNGDGTWVIGDPAMGKVEMSVDRTDYRLKGTGRVWCVW